MVEEKYPVDSTIQGTVTNIVNYGVFVQLEEGIEGLIHISKMPLDANNAFPSDIVNKDDVIEVIILKISKDSRRISLGIRSDRQNPFKEKKVEGSPDEPPPREETESEIPDESPESIVVKPIEKMEETKPSAKNFRLCQKSRKIA